MIREALDISPRVYARYEFGRERAVDLNGMIHLLFCSITRRIRRRRTKTHWLKEDVALAVMDERMIC